MEDSRFVREAVYDRLATTPNADGGHAGWARVYGSWGRTDSDGNAARADRDIAGFLIGGEAFRGEGWRVGVLGGYAHSTVDVDARLSTAKADDYQLGVYGDAIKGDYTFRVGASYDVRKVDTDRRVAFTGFSDHDTAGYDASVGQAFGEVSRAFKVGKAQVEPFGNLAAVKLTTDAFQETGGAAALTGRAKTQSLVFTTLGARASTELPLGKDGTVTVSGLAGWRHASGDVAPKATQAFSAGRNFTVEGPPVGENLLVLEAGMEGRVGPGATFGVSYSGQIGDGVSDHGVKASLHLRF